MTATGVRLKLVRERLQTVTEQVEALRALPQASKEEFLADRLREGFDLSEVLVHAEPPDRPPDP